MSTEPQVARVESLPEHDGSPSRPHENAESPEKNSLPDEDTLVASVQTNGSDPAAAAQVTPAQTEETAAPSTQSMTGRPAFPNKNFSLPEVEQPAPPKTARKSEEMNSAAAPAPARSPQETPSETANDAPAAVAPASHDDGREALEAHQGDVAADITSASSVDAHQPAAEPEAVEVPQADAPNGPGAPVPGIPDESSPSQEALAASEIEVPNYDELIADYDEPAIRAGDLCKGQIVSIDGDNVIVHYGGKTEGVVPLAELREAGLENPAPGQDIEITVESLGGPGDYATLSYLKAFRSRIWEQIENSYRSQEVLTAKVVERVKGGLTVDIGLPAFLPGSQADVRPVPDLDSLVGQEVPIRIVKLSRNRGNVVVSRRALLEEELKERRRQTLAQLEEGKTVTGTVKNTTNYGVFIDLGGIDGLLHVTDISWGRVRNPAEIMQVGEETTLKVLKFDREKERVSLSLKHLHPDPWENIEQRYQQSARVTGRIVSITDYGAFVELGPGLEGLIHVSELSWSKRLKHPSKVLKIGQDVEAVVTQLNTEERRVSLSLKQLQPDPWANLHERYPIGEIVEGRVRNLTSYGAFVEIEEGVDGLVHVSDLSWSNNVKHPKDMLKKGQVISAVVLHVDEENRRVSLGVKQLEPDVWEKFFSLHVVGEDVKGQVTRFAKFGAFVELAPGVEGLCHNSEMSAHGSKQGKPAMKTGQDYEFRIIKIDEFDKKISLSRRAYEQAHPAHATNGTGSVPVESSEEALPTLSEESA